MVIYRVISATAAEGKEEEAVKWLTKTTQYVNENYSSHAEGTRSLDGAGSRYHWVEKCESLAVWEENNKKQLADATLQAMVKELPGLFKDFDAHFYEVVT